MVRNGDGVPIGSATVELRKADSDEVVDVGITDGNGVFGFSDVAYGSYRMVVSGVGYVDHEMEVFTLSGSAGTFDAGDIVLEEGGEVGMGGSGDWVWVAIGILACLMATIVVVVLVLLLIRRKGRGEEELD